MGERTVPALFHHGRIPWVVDALLDGELDEIVEAVRTLSPHHFKRPACMLRLLLDRWDCERCRWWDGWDLVEIAKAQHVVTAEHPHRLVCLVFEARVH